MFADLHIHTYFSDGTKSPEEVVLEAKEKGIGLISVCDHNSVHSYSRLKTACNEYNIKYIAGVEIDCSFNDSIVHILAYNCSVKNKKFLTLLRNNNEIMEQMSVDLILEMSKDYPQITIEEYNSFKRNPKNGGWKGIDYLKSKGFDGDYPNCMKYYDKYNIKPCGNFETVKTVCELIHSLSGVAVLAHPQDRLGKEKFIESLYELKNQGIDGVECYYPSHSKEKTDICVDFCNKNNLLITAGSDSHGDFAKFVEGVFYSIGAIKVDTTKLNLKGLV